MKEAENNFIADIRCRSASGELNQEFVPVTASSLKSAKAVARQLASQKQGFFMGIEAKP